MTTKTKPDSAKSQSQKERFIETARALEVDESGEAFESAFAKIVPPNTEDKKTPARNK